MICIVDIFNISENSVGGIHPACISVKKHYIDDRLTTQRYSSPAVSQQTSQLIT